MFDENSRQPMVPSVTRRSFVAGFSVMFAGGVPHHRSGEVGDVRPENLVLGREDLPDPTAYVEHEVDLAEAPLVQHLRRSVPEFEADGVASGFEARTADPGVPRFVESGAFKSDRSARIAQRTDQWFRTERDAVDAAVRSRGRSGTVRWTCGHSDCSEMVQLEFVGEYARFVVAGGVQLDGQDPIERLDRAAA